MILDFIDPPPDALKSHEYRVDARVVVAEAEDAIRVPLGALVRDAQGWAIYRLEGSRVELVRVVVGIQDSTHRVVEKGLVEGDRVVLFPSGEIANGVRVRIRP